jgi:hypothetical protein
VHLGGDELFDDRVDEAGPAAEPLLWTMHSTKSQPEATYPARESLL